MADIPDNGSRYRIGRDYSALVLVEVKAGLGRRWGKPYWETLVRVACGELPDLRRVMRPR